MKYLTLALAMLALVLPVAVAFKLRGGLNSIPCVQYTSQSECISSHDECSWCVAGAVPSEYVREIARVALGAIFQDALAYPSLP